MISARVKDFSQLRRCNAVRFCIWIGSSPFFLYCKVYSYRNGIYAIIFYVGCMASDTQWQEKKMIPEYLQYILLNVNSRFRCVSVLTLWNAFLLMQRFIHQMHKLRPGLQLLTQGFISENKCCSGQFHQCHFSSIILWHEKCMIYGITF